jgi:putative ABC transport system permease protein
MNTLWQDLRYGARMLTKSPGFTAVAVVALALGIGANTAIFSVVNAVLLASLPYRDADRLATVWEVRRERDPRGQNVINMANFFDWKEQNNVFEDMAAFFDTRSNLTGDGEPEEIPGQMATPNLFSLLGANAMLGRTFTPDDGKPDRPRVVVISHGLWQRRFGSDPSIIGRKLMLNNQDATVIGVMPPDFSWHVRNGSMTRQPAEVWSPWQIESEMRQRRRGRFASAVARLKPGVTLTQAQAAMDAIGARLAEQHKDFNAGWGVNVVPLRLQFTGEIRQALWILFGAVGFVLLIACANVANLLLARAAARQREMAVRAALGAGRWRIVRQLLTESVLLSALGGAAGLALAWWGIDALVALSPPELPDLAGVKISAPVLGFTFGVALLVGVVFGLVPAFEASRFDLHESLKEGGRSGGGGARSNRLRGVFVVAEVALALVLLVGAGLFIRSFSRLQAVDPGFDAEGVLTMRVSLPLMKYDSDRKRIDFFRQAVERLRALPGVESAGAVSFLPFAAPHSGTSVDIEGRPKLPPSQALKTGVSVADARYFRTMRIPLKRGRLFTEQEEIEARRVVVINEAFARKHFPNEDPLGKRLTIYMKTENVPTEIIGVVGDNRHAGLDKEAEPMSYWPHPELTYSLMTLVVRAQGDPAGLAAPAREVIRSLDPEQAVADVRTMDAWLSRSTARARFNALLLAVFAGVAALLAAVGIYGVMAYSVAERTREVGIRLALGAQKRDVLRLVVGQGMRLALVGVGLGLGAAFALTRLMAGLLFGVSATDPLTFTAVALALALVALLACYVPARRAARVDPMEALRYE